MNQLIITDKLSGLGIKNVKKEIGLIISDINLLILNNLLKLIQRNQAIIISINQLQRLLKDKIALGPLTGQSLLNPRNDHPNLLHIKWCRRWFVILLSGALWRFLADWSLHWRLLLADGRLLLVDRRLLYWRLDGLLVFAEVGLDCIWGLLDHLGFIAELAGPVWTLRVCWLGVLVQVGFLDEILELMGVVERKC